MGKRPALTLLLSLILLSGCGSETGFVPGPQVPAFARVVNLLPDSHRIFYEVDGTTYEGSLAFNESTGFLQQIPLADLAVRIYYVDTNDQQIDLYQASNLRLDDEEYVTIIVTGTRANPEVDIIRNQAVDAESDILRAQMRYYHGGSNYQGAVDFYFEETAGAATTPTVTLSAGEASELFTIDLTDNIAYHIRVTPAGEDTVLWESGTFTVGSLESSIIILTDHFGPANQDVRVLRASGAGTQLFFAESLPAAVRLVNLVTEVPAVDVDLVDTTVQATDLASGTIGDYQLLTPEVYSILVTDSATDDTLNDTSFNVVSGIYQTITLAGPADDVIVRSESNISRAVADGGRISIVYASIQYDFVDVYLLGAGEDLNDVFPSVRGASLLGETQGTVPPGTYDLVVTEVDQKTPVFGPRAVSLDGGDIVTIYLTDSPGGVAPIVEYLVEESY